MAQYEALKAHGLKKAMNVFVFNDSEDSEDTKYYHLHSCLQRTSPAAAVQPIFFYLHELLGSSQEKGSNSSARILNGKWS
jgi:hypothetical protein